MTEYMRRLETGDRRAVAFRDGIMHFWQRVSPYFIAHRGKEWWQVGCH
jgi:hypothetical protein